jgi:hypothetical protein
MVVWNSHARTTTTLYMWHLHARFIPSTFKLIQLTTTTLQIKCVSYAICSPYSLISFFAWEVPATKF